MSRPAVDLDYWSLRHVLRNRRWLCALRMLDLYGSRYRRLLRRVRTRPMSTGPSERTTCSRCDLDARIDRSYRASVRKMEEPDDRTSSALQNGLVD